MSALPPHPVFTFAGFCLDAGQRTLLAPDGQLVPLASRAFDTLLYMVEHPGELLDKKRLMNAVWPHAVVEENNLNQNILVLRRALGEAPGEHRFIITIPGRGFRFVPAVTRKEPAAAPAAELEAGRGSAAPPEVRQRGSSEAAAPAADSASSSSSPRRFSRGSVWLGALAVVAMLSAPAILNWRSGHDTGIVVAQPSIAVLPFADVSPNKDQEYFADGLAEELLNQLAQLRELRVIGRSSSFSFKGKNQDLRSIGRALGVDHLLEGSVRKAGEDIRVTAHLVDAATGSQIWSGAYDRKLDDVFAIQAEIAKSVAASLRLTLSPDAKVASGGGTRNPAAYDAYLSGIALIRRGGREETANAIAELERAVALDPDFASAWAALAAAYSRTPIYLLDTDAAATARALRASSRALELAPDSPGILAAASVMSTQLQDWLEAERRLQKAHALSNGQDYQVNLRYGWFLVEVGRPREAIEFFRRARRAEPLLLQPSGGLEGAFTIIGDFDAADAERAQGRNLIGDQYFYESDALLRAMIRRDRAAITRQLAVLQENVFSPVVRAGLDDPEAGMDGLRRLYRDSAVQASAMHLNTLAHWAVYFADEALALEALRSAFGPGQNLFYLWRPDFKGVRAQPGFKEIVRKVGLVEYWRQSGKWGEFCRPAGANDFECS